MKFTCQPLDSTAASLMKTRVNPYQRILAQIHEQVIDHESNVFLLSLGGQGYLPTQFGEPADHYALNWQDNWVSFEAYQMEESHKGQIVIAFDIVNLRMSKVLENELAEIEQAIKESIKVYWSKLRKEPEGTINFDFKMPQPIFYQSSAISRAQ